jgi:hypothetical protein
LRASDSAPDSQELQEENLLHCYVKTPVVNHELQPPILQNNLPTQEVSAMGLKLAGKCGSISAAVFGQDHTLLPRLWDSVLFPALVEQIKQSWT